MKTFKNITMCLVVLSMLFTGCKVSVNKSIHIEDGKRFGGDLNAVNGNITIGSDCTIRGDSRSVNGAIRVGYDSKVGDLQSVNGDIDVEENVRVYGSIQSVNGSIQCREGVEVRNSLTAINGSMELENTKVNRNLITYNGDISLYQESRIGGDIIVKRNRGSNNRKRRLTIEIADNSVVEGDILVQDPDIDVKVRLSNGGKVLGRIKNAEAIEDESDDWHD